MPEYKLPDVGEGLTEAEIVTWKVKVGDEVKVNDIVVEIETAKSLVELPSPYAGTVTALLVPEGEMVPVGTPIISVAAPGEEQAPAAPAGDAAAAPELDLSNPAASGGGEGESLVGRAKAERAAKRRRRTSGIEVAGEKTAHAGVQDSFTPGGGEQHTTTQRVVDRLLEDSERQAAAAGTGGAATDVPVPTRPAAPAGDEAESPGPARALAKPPVRKLARDLGVDLASLTGSGPSGSVTREDVQAAASGGADAGASEGGPDDAGATPGLRPTGARETREPIRGVRRMMGQAMVDSAFSAPHVTEWITVDVTEGMAFVDRLRQRREFRDARVGPLLLLARAAMLAMRRTPEINSYWDEDAQEVVYKGYVNLGIAAATPRGLVVPNVKDADQLSLRGLADALDGLVATAREGRTQPAEMSGGTFTITNVGVFGVDAGTPIINPGESAILCFGAVRKQPWVVSGPDGDRIEPRQVTTLALSFDHRHVDGEKGSRFLADVAGMMADPGTALLF